MEVRRSRLAHPQALGMTLAHSQYFFEFRKRIKTPGHVPPMNAGFSSQMYSLTPSTPSYVSQRPQIVQKFPSDVLFSEQRSICHQADTAVTCDPRSSRYLSSLSTKEHLTWRTVLSLSRRGLSASHPAPRLSPHSTLRTMICGYSESCVTYVRVFSRASIVNKRRSFLHILLSYRALQLLRSVHLVSLAQRTPPLARAVPTLVFYYAPRTGIYRRRWKMFATKVSQLQVGEKFGSEGAKAPSWNPVLRG